MIYFYKHKTLNEFSQKEIDMMGFEGVSEFAHEHNLLPQAVFNEVKLLEELIANTNIESINLSTPENKFLFDFAVNHYIDFFNKHANYNKQAYVIIGNIGSGKSTYANAIEEDTHSIIIDPDRFKCGEQTPHGYFTGLSSLFSPKDRERLQKPSSLAAKQTTENLAKTGMNIIIPAAPTSTDKLESKISSLIKNNYDIHLIYFDAPYSELADRSYKRYLIREYEQKLDPNGNQIHGRFVPISVILEHGEPCHETFAKAYNQGRYKSYKAFYNDKTTNGNEEIDLPTMI